MATNIPNQSDGGKSPNTGTTPPSDQPTSGTPVRTEMAASPVPQPTSGLGSGSGKPGTSAPGTSAPGIGPSGGVNKTLEPGAKGGTVIEDTGTDKALKALPRVAYQGKEYPALAGIPLLRKLGQGGMGAVYYGIHPRLGNEVAVKILPVHLVETNPTLVDRFLREARIAAQIKSPHLPVVSDVNEETGLYYLVMEFVNGLTGAKYLSNVKKNGAQGLLEAEAILIITAACEGLQVAHAVQIVHRDIKPDNIMIPYRNKKTKELDFEMAKVMDLGLARHSHESGEESADALTATQMAMGTPGYMAPEQVMDARKAGVRSDVFSMGATLYAMLAGSSPFHKSTSIQTLMATMECAYEPLAKARPDASPFIVSVVERCLLKSPEERFANAGELMKVLKQGSAPQSSASASTAAMDGMTIVSPQASSRLREATATAATPAATPSPVPVAAAPAPPKKKGLVLAGAALGAVLIIGGAAFFLTRGPGKPDVQVLLAQVDQKVAESLLDDAEKQLSEIEVLYPKEPGIATRRKKIADEREAEKADIPEVERNVKLAREAIKKARETDSEGTLTEAQPKIRFAKKLLPKYPMVLQVEQEYETAKKELGEKEALRQKRATFDQLVADAGDLLKKGEKLGDAETKLNTAKELFPQDQKLLQLLAELKDKKERVASLGRALRYASLALESGDLNEAEAKLADAKKISPDDPKVVALQESLDAKKKVAQDAEKKTRETFQGLIAEANTLIESNKLDEVDPKIREAAKLFPDDPAIAATRQKLSGKQSVAQREAAEKQRRLGVIADLEAVLKTDDLNEAKKQLDAAEAAYKQDKDIAPLRAKYDEKKKLAEEKKKHDNFSDMLANADKLLKTKDADPVEIQGLLDDARKLFPDDKELAARDTQLKQLQDEAKKKLDEQQKQARFDGYLKAAEEILGKENGSLADAQAKLDSAKELKPNDTQLKSLLAKVETKRQEKTVKDIRALLDKGDLVEAGKQIEEAEFNSPGNYLQVVKGELTTKKTARDTECGNATTALDKAGSEAQLAEAQKLVEAFKAKYPTDKELGKLEVSLGTKKGVVVAAAQKQEREAAFQSVKRVLDALGPAGKVSEAQQQQFDEFPKKYANSAEAKDLAALRQTKQADALAFGALKSAVEALGLSGTLSDTQKSQLDGLKNHYANDPGVRALDDQLKTKAADALAYGNLKTAVEALGLAGKLTNVQSGSLDALKQKHANDAGLRALDGLLASKATDGATLASLKSVATAAGFTGKLDAAQSQQLDALKLKYANDQEIKNLSAAIDEAKRREAAAVAQQQAAEAKKREAAVKIQNLIAMKDKTGAQNELNRSQGILDADTVKSLQNQINAIQAKVTPPLDDQVRTRPPPPPVEGAKKAPPTE